MSMFKKAKKLSPRPGPPTAEQILEDLETYTVERKLMEKFHSLDIADVDEPNMDDWWKVFETFLEDHEQFHNMKVDIENLKKRLLETQSQLQAARDDVQRQIDEDLEKLIVTINS